MADGPFTIRPMRADEIALATDWAAAEGWNPGLGDAAVLRDRRSRGFSDRRARRQARRRPSQCVNYDDALRLPGLLHRAAGSARPRLRLAHLAGRDGACRASGRSASTASWRSRTTTANPGFTLAYRQRPLRRHACRPARRRARRVAAVRRPARDRRAPTTRRCFRRRGPPSCAPGSAAPAMSGAR